MPRRLGAFAFILNQKSNETSNRKKHVIIRIINLLWAFITARLILFIIEWLSLLNNYGLMRAMECAARRLAGENKRLGS